VSSRSALPLKKTASGQESPSGLLKAPLPPVNDSEGQYVPASLPFIVDAHVHFFPDHFFSAVWQWFDQFGWPIRYRLTSPEIIDFLLSHGVNHLERVLRDYPNLNICVPHLGADEFDAYRRMLLKYDNLWLDTTMTLADYLPMDFFPELIEMRVDRIIFGTDFPNLPYAWDREIRRLIELKLPDTALEKILGKNALEFYSITCETVA